MVVPKYSIIPKIQIICIPRNSVLFANVSKIDLSNIKLTKYNSTIAEWRVVQLVLQAGILLFHFIGKINPPVCSTVPASLQAQGHRQRDCNNA